MTMRMVRASEPAHRMHTPPVEVDWLVVGSGFGGSVAALRLAEKGYRVAVLEAGRRYADEDFAESAWQLAKYFWLPALGLRGILRLAPFKDIFVAAGTAVGGGSTVYANTLYRAKPEFFTHAQWRDLADWATVLAPHYATAERMLGVTEVPFESDAQRLLQDVAERFGVGHTFTRTPVGVHFGAPDAPPSDPYFGGEGPLRAGCTRCGSCMIGCRVGAKNTLLKNYLWFAERRGAAIHANQAVVDVRPAGAADGSDGYVVTSERPGAWLNTNRRTWRARGVVFAAGALGTNELLATLKHGGALPRLSDRLGALVRTNSESILAVTLPDDSRQPWADVAISASIHVDANTHIELCTFGRHGDAMSLLLAPLTGNGTRVTRPVRLIAAALRHPLRFLRARIPFGWSKRALLVLVMQSHDNAIRFRAVKRWWRRRVRLATEQDSARPNPTFIPAANAAAEYLAAATGGVAQSSFLEAAVNIPTTAHLLGGAAIGADAAHGVVDQQLRAFGYANMLVEIGRAHV